MKNFSAILNVILVIAVGYLYFLHFKKDKPQTTVTTPKVLDTLALNGDAPSNAQISRIYYVDIDTINANYSFIKNQRAAIEKQQNQAEATLKSKSEALEKEIIEYQKKMQAGELTQVQAMEIEKNLGKKQQDLMAQEKKLAEQLMNKTAKIQEELNDKMKSLLKVYLDKYQADYILGFTEGANILLTNPELNITNEVLEALNASAAK